MGLFDGTKIPVLGKSLDAYALRHKVIGSNIANIATPGYKSRGVEFESELASALKSSSIGVARTNPRHIGGVNPLEGSDAWIAEVPGERTGGNPDDASGVNNVDLDREMVELAKNQIRFRFSSRMITEAFRGIQKSIRGTT